MGWFKRAPIVVLLSALAVSMTSAGVLAAGNPGPTPVPPPPTVQGNFCGDLGLITASADVDSWNATMKTFTSKNGSVELLFTGHQRTIVQGNGKTLTFDSSGPGRITIYPDGTVTLAGTGHLFYIGPPGTPQPGIFLYSGATVIDISDPTNATVSSYHGNKLDVCALLAA
jgi:hypothetical protein